MLINKTYSVVTPESAADGDYAETGFEFEDYRPNDLRDVVRKLEDGSCPRLNDWDHGSATVYFEEGIQDYHTGSDTTYALHFTFESKAEARAFARIWRLYFR
jgi:hypothetical protein